MGKITVQGFHRGLDSRHLPETTPAGALIKLDNGDINRGSEIEQRPAFVPTYTLPAGLTKSLSRNLTQIVVFGESAAPTMPVGVTYQQLVHPLNAAFKLVKVLSSELFAGKVYAIGLFEDGSIYHYYDGTRVTDWNDKRARTRIDLTGGIVGGTISSILINGVEVLGLTITWADDTTVETMAAAIGAQINAYLSTPEYTASVFAGTVAILAVDDGTASNGFAVAITSHNVAFTGGAALSGGIDENGAFATGSLTVTGGSSGGSVTSILVGGVEVLGSTVNFDTDAPTTAIDIADQINAFSSNPDYTATNSGATITLTAVDIGADPNGFAIGASASGITFSSTSFAGGQNPTFQSGTFVKSGNKQLYSLTGGTLAFSGLQVPTQWFSSEATGAGFLDLSDAASNSDTLTSLAKYQSYFAFFSDRTIQIQYMDPDPSLNKQIQVLANTGTISPRSVVQYGDNDVFYLDESGVRSIRARDASNAAITTDMGVPVDTLIAAIFQQLNDDQRANILAVIEPSLGRYWLVINDEIFAFSSFQEASINAWSHYTLPFSVDDILVNPVNRKVYLRSGDTIYVFGGLTSVPQYDDTPVEAWLPYLDNGSPTVKKTFAGIDAACKGEWEIRIGLDPTNLNASDLVARVSGTTYSGPDIDGLGEATHFSARLKSTARPAGGGPAVLGAVVIHYDGEEEDDE